MSYILPGILSLIQYKNDIEHSSYTIRPARCEHCGQKTLWRHGDYPRQSSGCRNNSDASMNPISIQRYYCRGCCKTMSVLPECIPRNRWYLWSVQQLILLLSIKGTSINKIAKIHQPSRHTIARWINRFKDVFLVHRDILIQTKETLAQSATFNSFWQACLSVMNLSEAMRICHVFGVFVP